MSPARRVLITVLVPIALVLAVTFGLIWWERGAPPGMRPEAVPVTPETITREHRGVQIQGTAHLEARLRQTIPGEAGELWLYPLLPKGDLMGRTVRVLVQTSRKPDELYGFEDRTLQGFARPPGRAVPASAREALEKKGYLLADDLVLVEEWTD
jgi:hypothetical protein